MSCSATKNIGKASPANRNFCSILFQYRNTNRISARMVRLFR